MVCVVARAAPGDLDGTFSGDGKVTTNFTTADDRASGVAIQANGRIVAAGWAGSSFSRRERFALARYRADGTLDSSFGTDGRVTTRFTIVSAASAVAIQLDGKILAVGYKADQNTKFALARYKPDGTRDPMFSGDGKATTLFFPLDNASASDVVIQPDGKFVVVGTAWCEELFFEGGWCRHEEDSRDIALARYNADGIPDPSFGTGGKITSGITGIDDVASAVALQADGKIVVAGAMYAGNGDFFLLRYNADGTPDSTFGVGGQVRTDFGFGKPDSVHDLAIQGDGKIVAAGRTGGSAGGFALARYNPDGTLDTTFDEDGKVRTDFTKQLDVAYGVAIQATGKIVAAGRASVDGGRFALARYTTDGTLDTSFSGNGKVTTDFTPNDDAPGDVAIQANGRIVAVGRAGARGVQANGRFALARYRGA
jgi:uncharacterized delta-60 repeat protein